MSDYSPNTKKHQTASNSAGAGSRAAVSPPGGDEDGEKSAGGLSTAHNCTLASAVFWVGGSKARVNRNSESRSAVGGGKRGTVTGFSYASRRRLMRKLAELDREVKPLFVTLTFPDEYHSMLADARYCKKVLRRFIERFRRAFDGGSAVWRLEFERRKSGRFVGEVFPHFHLLIYGVSWSELVNWISSAWWEVCGRLSDAHLAAGTKVERLRSHKGVMRYVSKYIAKSGAYPAGVGRVWGVVAAENLPWVRGVLVILTESQAVQLVRYFRRYAKLKGRDYKSLTVFLDAGFWWRALEKILLG